MKLLYTSERPPFPLFLGGAARSASQLLSELATNYNYECVAMGSSDFSKIPWEYPNRSEYISLGVKSIDNDINPPIIDCGYSVQVIADFFSSLEQQIDSIKPDIVWAQMEGAKEIFRIARRKGILCIFFVRDAEFNPVELELFADLGVNFVCNSLFLSEKVFSVTGKKAAIVFPSLDASYGVEGDKNGYITMINPHKVKGVETFLEIARQMPDEKFLLLESWKLDDSALQDLRGKLIDLPHVRLHRRTSDMSSIYAQTKLLLVPSIWEEAFGRVAIEAQSCKIPVIASFRGGLPEAVGDGGLLINDYLNADEWVKNIRELLTDKNGFENLREHAFIHANQKQFSVRSSAQKFDKVCKEVMTFKDNYRYFRFLIAKSSRFIKKLVSK